MRHNTHQKEQFSEKVQKYRQQIRHRQIEQHKKKIRKLNQLSNKINNYHMSIQHQNKKNLIDNINKEYYLQHNYNQQIFIQQKIQNIYHTIEILQNQFILSFPKEFNQQINDNNKINQYKQLKENIQKNYTVLLDLLLQNDIENKQVNFQGQKQEQKWSKQLIRFVILSKISKLSKIGLHFWDSEQRCTISYTMQKYLLDQIDKYQESKNYSIHKYLSTNFNDPSQRLQLILHYIMNIMIKDINFDIIHYNYQQRYYQHMKNYQIFDFTLIQQSILIHLVTAVSLLLQNVDIGEKIYQQLGNAKTRKQQQLAQLRTKTPSVLRIINGLTNLYIFYIKLYSREVHSICISNTRVEQKDPCIDEETGDIGNVNLSCVKAVLGIAVHVLAIVTKCIDNNLDEQKKINMISQLIVTQMHKSINYTIELFHQFFIILESLPNQQFKILQDQTCIAIHQSIFGILCLFCDTIVNVVEYLQEIQECYQYRIEDQFSNIQLSVSKDQNIDNHFKINNKQKLSQNLFNSFKNREIVQGLHLLIDRKLYTSEYINQIYHSSKVSIYLMTCIFSCNASIEQKQHQDPHQKAKHQDKPHPKSISYEKYRQCQSKLKQTICFELECLKTVEVFQKNYEIKVDIEDNLQIRYLSKIGDGKANLYYYQNLAGFTNYFK